MGASIETEEFSAEDYARFKAQLPGQLRAFERLVQRPGFGDGVRSLGVEVELFLIDGRTRPLPISLDVVARVDSPRVTPEIDRFEIELASQPVPLAGRPFAALERSVTEEWARIDQAAQAFGARTVAFGILPTLRPRDLTERAITGLPRYRALTAGLRRLRQSPFEIRIDGDDPLDVRSDHAAMEGANTAFQIHLRASPGEFAALYNAALVATAPALAVAANSPTFLGHRLWEETRVALFKQAGDVRSAAAREQDWRPPPRINFGTGWMREGAAEQLRESCALHEPLLPVVSEEGSGVDPEAVVERGGAPALAELRLHHGTVWYWNRVVYDPTETDPHLRIELRALPAGPTVADMMANAAFLVGLILDLAPEMNTLLPGLPFACAERNFYRAAQFGLAAELLWPIDPAGAPQPVAVRELLPALVERARRGLLQAGVAGDEVASRLDIVSSRVETGMTGASWQRAVLRELEAAALPRDEAVAAMVERYVAHARSGQPVHRWATDA